MGAEVSLSHTHLQRAAEIVGFDIPPVRGYVGGAGKALEGDVSMACGDVGYRAFGDLDGQIRAAIVPIRSAQRHAAAIHRQTGS